MALIEKTFANDELEIELISYIDHKQNIWFKEKDIAKILGYRDRPNVQLIENETDLHCKVVQYIRRFYYLSSLQASVNYRTLFPKELTLGKRVTKKASQTSLS